MAYSVSALGEFNPQMNRTENPDSKTTAKLFSLLVLLCCLVLAVAACGQRGPLYLPDPETRNDQSGSADQEKQEEKAPNEDEETP